VPAPPPPPPAPDHAPLDLARAAPLPIAERRNKVDVARFGRPVSLDASVREFLDALPGYLGAEALRDLARHMARARRGGRPVVLAIGAHVVKVGCGPHVIDLIERGLVTALAVNGAFAIHDWELAAYGATSEDVAVTIRDGSFGWARETGEAFARAARRAVETGAGLGRALGESVHEARLPNAGLSVLAACARRRIPCGVFVAVGTDIVHMHAALSGADLGAASHADFRILASVVSDLEGGAWVNIGSAVILPEVFLKLVSIARRLGKPLADVTAGNLDMIAHYRTSQNVLARPVARGFSLIGQHEVLVPLLRLAVIDAYERNL
jgi:hypothetical protein